MPSGGACMVCKNPEQEAGSDSGVGVSHIQAVADGSCYFDPVSFPVIVIDTVGKHIFLIQIALIDGHHNLLERVGAAAG